jgi:hypothetical protein
MPNLLGLHLQLLLGDVPAPAPLKVAEALESVEVTLKDKDQSGFQLVFQIGRSVIDFKDYSLMKEARLKPFTRVLLNVFFGIRPLPIMDGVITNQQLAPGEDPGTSKLTVQGKDISVMIDREQKAEAYPNLSEPQIVTLILTRDLTRYRVIPRVESIGNVRVLTADRQTPTQDKKSTHLAYIKKLAERFGFVFFVETGDVPGTNVAYWGPPPRRGPAQGALSVNLGPNTNIESISFRYDEEAPTRVRYDAAANTQEVVSEYTRAPRLAARIPSPEKLIFLDIPDGLTDREARRARAQAKVNESFDGTVTASGTLDALRYGRILRPRMLLDVRGAGEHFSGTYYVSEVKHKIDVRKGEYKQDFKINREGVGLTSLVVNT